MALSEANLTVLDGALGIAAPTDAQTQVKIGVSQGGSTNTLYAFSDSATMQSTLGAEGAMVESAAHVLAIAGGQVMCLPVNPSAFGYAGTVTLNGTSPAVPTISLAPSQQVVITITTAGAVGTMAFTYKVGSGATSQPVASSDTGGGSFVWRVPGTYCFLTFAAGTYVLSSTYTIATSGVITRGGSAINTVTQQSSPVDAYQVILTVVNGGALGVGTFTYSLDGGDTTSAQIQLPSGATYVIPASGIVVTFTAGTYVAGDTYSFLTVGPGYSTSDLNAALAALRTTYAQQDYGFVHVVGTAASAASAASIASAVDVEMTAQQSAFLYHRAMTECPTVGTIIVSSTSAIADTADTDTVVAAAFASFNSTLGRVGVCAGDCELVSSVTGRIVRRNAAWPITARLSLIPISEDGAFVGRGSLTGVRSLYRDEFATPALDAARFNTLRTYQGKPGFFVSGTAGSAGVKAMTATTSDYYRFANGRVMDEACKQARAKALDYVQASVRVNKTTGYILEQDAKTIEAGINNPLREKLLNSSPPNASDTSVRVSRNTNILSSATLPIDVRVTPKGYIGSLAMTIGFFNPALAAA